MKKIILMIMIILMSMCVLATQKQYSSIGFSDQTYNSAYYYGSEAQDTLFNGNYNTVYSSPVIYSIAALNINNQPPISEIINGSYRIFAASGPRIQIYADKTLQTVSQSIYTNGTPYKYKVFTLSNGSQYLTILSMLANTNTAQGGFDLNFEVYFYNGTAFTQIQKRPMNNGIKTTGADFGSTLYKYDQAGFNCYGGYCYVAMWQESAIYDYYFSMLETNNNTGPSPHVAYNTVVDGGTHDLRVSQPFDITIKDIDGDGAQESIFLFASVLGNAVGNYKIYTIQETLNSNGYMTNLVTTNLNQYNNAKMVTNPIIGSFGYDDSTIALGFLGTDDKMHTMTLYYDRANAVWKINKEHSSLFTSKVKQMSNVFGCDILFDTSGINYCVVGWTEDNKIQLVAQTDNGVGFLLSDMWIATTSTAINVSSVPKNASMVKLAHSLYGSMSASDYGSGMGGIMTDIWINSGIYKISTVYAPTGQATLVKEYNFFNMDDAILSPIKSEVSPYYDAFMQTNNSIYYIDDKFVSPNPVIDAYSLDPFCNQPIEINSSVHISVVPKSYQDRYNVLARATLYYGDANQQQTEWSGEVTSGNTIFFTNFVANKTITNGVALIEIKDTNLGTIVSKSFTFSVANIGVILGECSTTATNLSTTSVSVDVSDIQLGNNATKTNNALTEGIRNAAKNSGMPTELFVVIIILVTDIFLFVITMKEDMFKDKTIGLLIFIGMVDLAALIVLAMMKLISAVFVTILILLVVIVGVLWLVSHFSKKVTGS